MTNKINFNELYQLIDIVLVISSKINLTKKGANYWGLCPFHSDSKPSLSVNQTKRIFKCFSCGASGNAIGFLQRLENLNFLSSLKEALTLSNVDANIIANISNNLKVSIAEKIYLLNKQGMILMNNYLLMSLTKKQVNDFVKKRKLDIKVINKFNLGYISNEYYDNFYASLYQYCQENFKDEIPDDLLKKTNLFTYNEKTKQDNLFFNNRLIFPIINKNSNVIGFGARDLTNESIAKYINSPESKIFIKGDNLYNFYSILNLENNHSILIVEGYMDCITLVNHGYLNAVATMGTALSNNQLNLIFELKNLKEITLSFDNDSAGENAFIKNLANILNYQINLDTFIPIYISGLHKTQYKDPDELFNIDDKNEASKLFAMNENALYVAAKFMLKHDANLEYSLNEALRFITSYLPFHFGIYVEHALKMFTYFVVQNYKVDQIIIDNLVAKLRLNPIEIKQKKNEINYSINDSEDLARTTVNDRYNAKLLQKLAEVLSLLNNNYVMLIFIFLYHPHLAFAFKKNYVNSLAATNLLANQKAFNSLNSFLKKLGLFEIYNKNTIEYWVFTNYSYLFYIYIDFFDFTKLKEGELTHNLDYILRQSNWFNNLVGDFDFDEAKGLLYYLENNLSADFNKYISIKKFTQHDVNEKVTRILANIFEILNKEIPSILLKIRRK